MLLRRDAQNWAISDAEESARPLGGVAGALRRCTKCGEEKPRSCFDIARRYKSGLQPHCKDCRRAYREANKEKIRAQQARYYEANREEIIARVAQWRDENRDHVNQFWREHRKRFPEKHEKWAAAADPNARYEAGRAYRERNAETIKARVAKWKEDNPDRVLASCRNRRARKKGAGKSHTAADVQRQLVGQKGRCWWCHKKLNGEHHVDHLIPLARGGDNGPGNIVIACPPCNLSKNRRMPHEFAGRLL